MIPMAHTVEQFPRRRRGRPPKYSWDRFFDDQIHVLYQGEDFKSELDSFRALVHRTANARPRAYEGAGPWKAHTQIDKDNKSVSFLFYIADEE